LTLNNKNYYFLEGCGGVPPIRPLETLHNALSLKQLDAFLDRMTKGLLIKTPASSPPRHFTSPTTSKVYDKTSKIFMLKYIFTI
jgi:hypothetical protein